MQVSALWTRASPVVCKGGCSPVKFASYTGRATTPRRQRSAVPTIRPAIGAPTSRTLRPSAPAGHGVVTGGTFPTGTLCVSAAECTGPRRTARLLPPECTMNSSVTGERMRNMRYACVGRSKVTSSLLLYVILVLKLLLILTFVTYN